MTPADIIARAERAKALLSDPLLIEATDIMEREIIEQFAACPTRDLEGLRLLQCELRRVRKFKMILQGVIEQGKLAAHDLREKESLVDKVKMRFR